MRNVASLKKNFVPTGLTQQGKIPHGINFC